MEAGLDEKMELSNDETKIKKDDGKYKPGRKAVVLKKSGGWREIGKNSCWIISSQRANRGKIAVIGRTKFNVVKIGKWKNKKQFRKVKLSDLHPGTVVALHC